MNTPKSQREQLQDLLAQSSSPTFRNHVESQLAEAEISLQALATEIETLKRRHEQEQARIVVFRGVLSPLRTFPTELMVKIFSEVEYTDSHGAWASPPSGYNEFYRVLIRLSSVCHRWRVIVVKTPSLWAQEMLAFHASQRWNWRVQDMVEGVLRRSAPLPISVRLCDYQPHAYGRPRAFEPGGVLEALARAAPRWKRLVCDTVDLHTPLALLLSESQPLPCLEELRLSSTSSGHPPDLPEQYPPPVGIFLESPALHRVYISASAISQVPLLPWAQLQLLNLDLRTGLDRDVAQLLASCASLVSLQLTLGAWCRPENEPPVAPRTRATLPLLTDLVLAVQSLDRSTPLPSDSRGLIFDPFFRRFTLPTLRRFRVSCRDRELRLPLEQDFVSFLRHLSELDELEIGGCDFSSDPNNPDTFLEILPNTPALTKFTLQIPPHAFGYHNERLTTLLEQLTYTPAHSVVAPKLHTLCLEADGNLNPFSAPALVELVQSRWWVEDREELPLARWRRIGIVVSKEWSQYRSGLDPSKLKEKMLAFQAQGLDFEVNFPQPTVRWQ